MTYTGHVKWYGIFTESCKTTQGLLGDKRCQKHTNGDISYIDLPESDFGNLQILYVLDLL